MHMDIPISAPVSFTTIIYPCTMKHTWNWVTTIVYPHKMKSNYLRVTTIVYPRTMTQTYLRVTTLGVVSATITWLHAVVAIGKWRTRLIAWRAKPPWPTVADSMFSIAVPTCTLIWAHLLTDKQRLWKYVYGNCTSDGVFCSKVVAVCLLSDSVFL